MAPVMVALASLGLMIVAACRTSAPQNEHDLVDVRSFAKRGPVAIGAAECKRSQETNAAAHTPQPTECVDADVPTVATASKEARPTVEAPTGAEAMARQRWMARAGDDGTIPPNALMNAKNQADLVPTLSIREGEGSVADAGIWNWEWLGPGNIGGRVRAIAMHPIADFMFAGAVSGGLWRTFNAGRAWEPVDDFLASLAVTAIVIDPTNSSTIYAATGEGIFGGNSPTAFSPPGAGVFISTDFGTNWDQLPSTAPTNPNPTTDPWGYVNRLAHHPTQSGVLFAATRNGGILRSAPNDSSIPPDLSLGLTWTQVLNPGANATDVEIDPSNASRVLVGTLTDVWMSNNNGDAGSWVQQTIGGATNLPSGVNRCEIDFGAPSTAGAPPTIWVSINTNNGEIWNSTDSGVTWNPINTGSQYLCNLQVLCPPPPPPTVPRIRCQGDYDNVIWASPDDPNLVVVGGIDLFRSIDGGATVFTNCATTPPISDWQDYHAGNDTDDDGNIGNSAHADHHFIVEPPNYGPTNRRVYFANDGGVQRALNIYTVTTNTGWTNLANNLGITQFYGGAAAPDGSVILGGSQDNDQSRYRPVDGAQAWLQPSTGDGGFAAVDYNDPTILYGERTSLTIRKSTDSGLNFTPSTSGLADARGNCDCTNRSLFIAPFVMDPTDPTILVAGGRSIWRTTDGASSWNAIRVAALGTCSASGATCGGGDCPPPQTCNFGSVNSRCSAIDISSMNSNRIWVGYSDGRVSRTTTSTSSWTNVQDNGLTPLPGRFVTDIAINPRNASKVFVTLGGYNNNSIWFTNDDGATWQLRQGTGTNTVPQIHVSTIRFHPTIPNWIYVGTDIGVFASDDNGLNWNRTARFRNAQPNAHDGPVNVEISELFWQGDYLVAATFGRGMWRVRPLAAVYVDFRNPGAEDGSLGKPFDTVGEGIGVAGHGTNMFVYPGTYDEPGTTEFFKRGVIRPSAAGSVTIR